MNDNTDTLITPSKAAEILGISPRTVVRWCDERYLRYTRTIGKHRRIYLSSVNELKEKQEG